MRKIVVALILLLAAPSAAQAAPGDLRAGAGQADITPPRMGYVLGGWTRADRVARAQSTRLFSNAIVLQRGPRKVALVAVELFAVPAGLQEEVARQVGALGLDRTNVIIGATHTHSGPGGFANNPTYNTTAPSVETVTDPFSYVRFFQPAPADRQLYTFLVSQIAASIRRADAKLAPAAAAWGQTELRGLTQNRSVEAHLANHGIRREYGQGRADQDPEGEVHTIDPSVDVLRVDHVVRRRVRVRVRGKRRTRIRTRRVPIGAYTQFANHGTVVKSETEAYSGDHHATAWRELSDRVRKAAGLPKQAKVIVAYPSGAEGDQSAGLRFSGADGARRVGEREADAFFEAWRRAGREMSRRPALDLRWTRACFCGRMTATGPVDTESDVGIGFLTGSEEGRGPLFDVTGVPFEGRTSPAEDPAQGNKVTTGIGGAAPAVPFTVLRIGDGALATIPMEPTKEVGVRVRRAVLDALRGRGVNHAIIGGLSGDFIQYVTTPEEYGQQSYEGASTLFGRNQGTFVQERLAELAAALAAGKPAPEPHPFDASYGVTPNGAPYGTGARRGEITEQPPPRVAQGPGKATLAWTGGANGEDRPVDRAFVSAQRIVRGRWKTVDSDLALDMLWTADGEGRYRVEWNPVRTVPAGTYRLRVTASNYTLESRTFVVGPG